MRSTCVVLFAFFLASIALKSFAQAFDLKLTTMDFESNNREVDVSDIIETPLNEGESKSTEQPRQSLKAS
jgi:hypothetical protein